MTITTTIDYKGKLRKAPHDADNMMCERFEKRGPKKRQRRTINEGYTTTKLLLLSLILMVSPSFVSAFAPPHENHTTFESARSYRLAHNITFGYHPTNLHPEVCKYMSEAECQHADESMKLHHETHQYNQRYLEANPNFDLNILVLLLRFTDHQDRQLPEPYEYQILLNLRVAKYLEANSYGKYRVWFDVVPWELTDNTEVHYSFGKSGRTKEFQKAFHPLLNRLYDEGKIGDWSLYDNDGDGVLDNLMVLTSSYPAEVGGKDCTNQRTDSDRIWSHALASTSDFNWVSKDGNLRSNGYTIASALSGTCDSVPAEVGVITHEFFHAIANIPDLYDTALDGDGAFLYRGKGGTGSFDIMSNPYGIGQNLEDFPSHLSAWTKKQMGWSNPTILNQQGTLQSTYTLRPSELYDDVLQVGLENFFGYEYLLIENRQRQLFDVHLFGEGLAIYHVDDVLGGQEARGYPGQEGWPSNGKHYRVAVLPADGKYDMENLVNRGDAGDFWKPGMRLGPGEGGEVFPNTDTYGQALGVFETGIEVVVESQNGDDIVVSVTIPDDLMGAPPKEPLLAPIKEEEPPRISGRFRTDWFKEESEEGKDEEEDFVDAVLPLPHSQEVGTGFAERPAREEDSASNADGNDTTSQPQQEVGVGTAERPVATEEEGGSRPAEDVYIEQEEEQPGEEGQWEEQGREDTAGQTEGEGINTGEEETDALVDGPLAENEVPEPEQPVDEVAVEQEPIPPLGGKEEQPAESGAEVLTPPMEEGSDALVVVINNENGETASDGEEEGGPMEEPSTGEAFATVEKETTLPPQPDTDNGHGETASEGEEEGGLVEDASAWESSVTGTKEPTLTPHQANTTSATSAFAPNQSDAEEELTDEVHNEGGDSSVFAELFTNTTKEDDGAETESDTPVPTVPGSKGSTIAPTMSPTEHETEEDTFDQTVALDYSDMSSGAPWVSFLRSGRSTVLALIMLIWLV